MVQFWSEGFGWMSWQINFKIVNIYTAERQLTAPKILKYGSEEKGSSLCRCSILLGSIMSKKQERLRSELLSEDKIFDIIKPRRIEHLQSEEPFSSDPYFNIKWMHFHQSVYTSLVYCKCLWKWEDILPWYTISTYITYV